MSGNMTFIPFSFKDLIVPLTTASKFSHVKFCAIDQFAYLIFYNEAKYTVHFVLTGHFIRYRKDRVVDPFGNL